MRIERRMHSVYTDDKTMDGLSNRVLPLEGARKMMPCRFPRHFSLIAGILLRAPYPVVVRCSVALGSVFPLEFE